MSEIAIALIVGLNEFGKERTFNEILTKAGFVVDPVQHIDLANKLELKGIIKSVTYRLPFEIRAELTEVGKKLLKRINSEGPGILDILLTFFMALSVR